MAACCVIGMGGAAAIFLFGVPANKLLTGFIVLLCPLSHLLMMKFMGHGGHQNHPGQLAQAHHSESLGESKGIVPKG